MLTEKLRGSRYRARRYSKGLFHARSKCRKGPARIPSMRTPAALTKGDEGDVEMAEEQHPPGGAADEDETEE